MADKVEFKIDSETVAIVLVKDPIPINDENIETAILKEQHQQAVILATLISEHLGILELPRESHTLIEEACQSIIWDLKNARKGILEVLNATSPEEAREKIDHYLGMNKEAASSNQIMDPWVGYNK